MTTRTGTTKKHRLFVSEPIGDKDVRTLPGIGDIFGARLSAKGFDKVNFLFKNSTVLKLIFFKLGIQSPWNVFIVRKK